jgi:hypothetical protein
MLLYTEGHSIAHYGIMARRKAHHLDAYARHSITTLATHGHVAMAHNRGIERATDGMHNITANTLNVQAVAHNNN